jgi:uncharacterized membrane protein
LRLENPMDTMHPPPLAFRRVRVSRGVAWWGLGWRSFLLAPWVWIGLSVVFLLSFIVLHALPLGGLLAQWLSLPLISLGAVFASVLRQRWARARSITPQGLAVEPDQEGALAESSRRWSPRIGALLLVSMLVLLTLFVLLAGLGVVAVTGFGLSVARLHALMASTDALPLAQIGSLGLGIGVVMLFLVLLLAVLLLANVAFWFVGTLVAIGGATPWVAVRLSMRAGFANVGALLVFTLILMALSMLLPLTAGLGVLVLLPVISGASYASYDEVFGPGAQAPG